MSEQDSISWGELALFTHATQVERFNFCGCEDITDTQPTPYADCPYDDGTLRHCGQVAEWADCDKCGADAGCFRVNCTACNWIEWDCDTTVHGEIITEQTL